MMAGQESHKETLLDDWRSWLDSAKETSHAFTLYWPSSASPSPRWICSGRRTTAGIPAVSALIHIKQDRMEAEDPSH